MVQIPAYLIEMNIRRYQGLLHSADTPAVTRETVTRLLAEARAMLETMEKETGGRL